MLDNQLTPCLRAKALALGFTLDAAQLNACAVLQTVFERLSQHSEPVWLTPLLPRWLRTRPAPHPTQGAYLHGGVGRGKSFILNAFFACAPLAHKQRVHFHPFMQDVHARLAALKGQENPVLQVAKDIARDVRLLCLDELQIADITDAMLMRALMQGLFDCGVAVVITANTPPDDLYLGGLQREQFLPTIALLKARMAIVPFDSTVDYRLNFTPPCADEPSLPAAFLAQAEGRDAPINTPITIAGRAITARGLADGAAWFDFDELCTGARGKADYIELANRFHTVCISDVLPFDQLSPAQARRFMWLIDEFYDRGVKLMFPDTAPAVHIGHASLLDGEFQRVLSRLAEMQSHTYLSR